MRRKVHFEHDFPFTPFSELFENLFEDIDQFTKGGRVKRNVPAVNIYEQDDSFVLELAAPGLSKADFKISLEKHQLTISSADIDHEKTAEEKKYRRKEFSFTNFKRTFTLPKSVDTEQIVAKYENGLLILTLNKRGESYQESRNINVD